MRIRTKLCLDIGNTDRRQRTYQLLTLRDALQLPMRSQSIAQLITDGDDRVEPTQRVLRDPPDHSTVELPCPFPADFCEILSFNQHPTTRDLS